ncbi:hypothetical protein SEUCBS139899_008800 [Sporothrix eucalyptigena]|uniref:ENTH domain-containing protein n=1 Tax=Sporothrix eucalyptigena TaxID=1812306 RepID=A0ABP0APS8_9PEZI
MASSFEKSVKGATKVKLAPPKTKYIEHILIATHADEAGVGEVFRALQYRLHDSTWTTVFKSLIVVHLMIREGSPDATLAYLAKHRNILAPISINDAQTQGRNIRHYATYLNERGRAYRDTKCDWVRVKETRLEKLTVDKGLLRETEAVQHQLTALLKCDVVDGEHVNEITIFVFRLLVLDLLALFQVLNQAMINILGHFFEMSKVDADRAMQVYRTFTRQTDYVVQFLSVARQYEHQTRVEVPKLKHAPVNLGRQLEEYLNDPDFEVHRRQYLAELEAKKGKGGSGGSSSNPLRLEGPKNGSASRSNTTAAKPSFSTTTKPAETTNGSGGGDLIDFFGSLEQTTQVPAAPQQQPQQVQAGMTPWGPVANNGMFQQQQVGMFQQQQQPQQQQNGFAAQPNGFQSTNPFQMQATGAAFPQQQQQQQPQLQPAYTGMGFGGFTAQPQQSFQPTPLAPIPQNSIASFQQQQQQQQQATAPQQVGMPTGQQATNPFRQSMMPTGALPNSGSPFSNGSTPAPLVAQQTSTNPFARTSPQGAQPFGAPNGQGGAIASPAPLVPMKTGTNPFAKDYGNPQQVRPHTAGGVSNNVPSMGVAPLMPQQTGSTNPFRQSAFINQNTGMGWQHSQPTGVLSQLETVPVFPRPAPQNPWQ